MLLRDVRILDFTRVLSGPWATMLLGDLGAEIIKIEEPGSGDESRQYGPPFLAGESVYYLMLNRNKRSVTINLRLPEGQGLVHDLVRHVDVVIHNFTPRFAANNGLAYGVLEKLNPALIYCGITGFGESGPYHERPGYDLMVMAIGGAMSVTGEPDRPPIKSPISFADILTGYNAAVGILSALLARRESGRGQKIGVNLLDSIVATLVAPMSVYFATGEAPLRESPDQGSQFSPGGTFATKDGFIAISANREKSWRLLCEALDMAALADDRRFCGRAQRLANKKELRRILEERLTSRSSAEWLEVFYAKGIPAGPIQTLDQVAHDPQVLHNQMVVSVQHPKCGPLSLLGTPLHLAGQEASPMQPPPTLGEHTEEVLGRYLGLDDAALRSLRERKVI